ncbi:hypothetical protein QUC31_005757 [Theobroma cacao]
MRRVQIGTSGSCRAPALTIKSLSYFPTKEKIFSHRDVASDDSEGEGSGQSKKPEGNVRRMSVQDAINLSESKQRDQVSDMPQKNSLTNVSLGASKSVLKRWSAGVGESSSQCQLQNASEDPVPEPPDNVIDNDTMGRSAGVDLESDSRSGGQIINETVDVNLERLEESSCSPIDVQEVTDKIQEDEANERSESSAEWSRQKEVELNQMFKKMMENQPVSCGKPQTNVRQNLPPEQRGGFYDHYKVKRDCKLRGENAGKRAEKEEKFRAMQKVLDERKAEMASKNVNNFSKKDPPTKSQKSVKNPPKVLKSPYQPANPRKEATKPSTVKKVSSRTSPLPTTCKSWPSTPLPRTTGISPAKTSGGISSAGTTPTHRKPQSAQSVPRPSSKVESAQPERKNIKATQADKRGLKSVNEKQQQRLMKGSKTIKTKVAAAPGDSSSSVPAKPSLYNKMTKKSSVVPLEAKPFLRKDQDISSLDHCDDDIQSETQVNGHQKSNVIESIGEPASDVDDDLKNIAESSKCEEELTISPAAWVKIEEHQDLPNQCDDNTGENTSSASIAAVGSASPRVRHSLSQMLQEESSEADTTEWGNAENPPAMVYQKDAPKGLKRLLKFSRKSKGDANITGWSSPSVFSEGEDDAEESKAINKRNADNLLRKAAL